MGQYVGRGIICVCGISFRWEASEQKYYAKMQLSPPLRCLACRLMKKIQWEIQWEQRQQNESAKRAARRAKLAPWVTAKCTFCQADCDVPERILGTKQIICRACDAQERHYDA